MGPPMRIGSRNDCKTGEARKKVKRLSTASKCLRTRPAERQKQIPRFARNDKNSNGLRNSRGLWASAEVAPIVQFVGVFHPAVANLGAIVHGGTKNILAARGDLGLRLLHGSAEANNNQHHAGCAGNEPLAVDFLYVFDVNAFLGGFLENDCAVF